MAKRAFTIRMITKKECAEILLAYHYLSGIQKGFKTGHNVGLVYDGKVVGVCIFTGLSVPETAKGCFGLNRDQQDGLFELSRLCLTPDVQESEHNIASWFVSRSIKSLRQEFEVRAILSYADSGYHEGIVYRALGFDYYGLSAPKKDFWFLQPDGSFKKHNRGKLKGIAGEWRPRTQKHRYLKVYDRNLSVRWELVRRF